ncbi:hypothetical protein ACHAXR_001641 [Thalassiosira sp. AJA248-18]
MDSSSKKTSFPFKLYAMLKHATNSSYSSVVSWKQDGRSFIIHDTDRFMRHVVPIYFKQTKFRSFTRQLNLWGFQNLLQNEWMHLNFVRGNIDELHFIERMSIKGSSKCESPTMKPKQTTKDKASEANDLASSRDECPPCKGMAQLRGEVFLPRVDRGENSRGNSRGNSSSNLQPSSAWASSLPLEIGSSAMQPIIQSNDDDYFLSLSKIIELEDNVGHLCRCSFCVAWADIDEDKL